MPNDVKQQVRLLLQVKAGSLEAMAHLEGQHITHRDIKVGVSQGPETSGLASGYSWCTVAQWA